jgi:Flp pilus assembly protein TadD
LLRFGHVVEGAIYAMKNEWTVLGVVCALVIGVYVVTTHSGYVVSSSLNVGDEYYNLLVRGFRVGQLNLEREAPPELARLADPYAPSAHAGYPVLDMSYYKGKLYLYYGVTPAALLFWPYVASTGNYLPQKYAVLVFCIVGFLASAGLLFALWRRYFAKVTLAAVAAGTLALGLVTCTPSLLARCDVWEVSISCGYALTMLALAAIWKALHEPERRCWWLAAASLASGLAVGARPSLLFGAVILLVPVAQAWRERRRVWTLLIAAIGPIALIGFGLMLYNALRFDSPFEFGLRYALSGDRLSGVRPFDLHYLWFHFQVYFLAPARWMGRFPFVREIAVTHVPAGHGRVEHPFGVLTNIPVVWLALAAPLAWRGRSEQARPILSGFLAAVAFLFGASALTLSLFFSASIRYEVEFLPALVLLAAFGILSVERALSDRPVWRRAARWGWSLLLVFSVAFSLLLSAVRCAEAHYNLGYILERRGRMPEAITQYEQAVRLNPDYAEAHRMLGNHLYDAGNVSEAIFHYRETVRLDPDWAEPHDNLGVALARVGKLPEAVEQFHQALRIDPNLAEAHNNLAVVLVQLGNLSQALIHFEQALQAKPDDAEFHYDFAVALERTGRVREAKLHYEQALRLKPDFIQAQNALAQMRANR